MNIGSVSLNALLQLTSPRPMLEFDKSSWPGAENIPANPAGPLQIFPINSATQLSMETVLELQRVEPESVSLAPPSAEELFLEEARKSPAERMREQVLEALGLTEDDLASMAPEERAAVEQQIADMIKEKMRQAMGADREAPDSNAAMIEVVV